MRNFTPIHLFKKTALVKKIYLKNFIVMFSMLIIKSTCAQNTVVDSLSEAYFFHINDYPNHQQPYWGDGDALTNGIAHDDKNWFITALGTNILGQSNDDWIIRKIPVNVDLMTSTVYSSVRRSQVPVLDRLGYNHLGDLDHFKYGSHDYLIVPMEKVSSKNLPVAIAIFHSSDLSFIDYAPVSGITDGIGWCAVSPADSCLYTSNDAADSIFIYQINWNQLESTHKLIVTFLHKFPLKIINGTKYYNMQGGEFTPDGKLLYINTGIISACACNPFSDACPCSYQVYSNDGIHVLNTANWQEIQHSTSNTKVSDFNCTTYQQEVIRTPQNGCFDYTFDNSGCSGEEPEGLTIWDIDKVPDHNSQVSGQLHVISYDHDKNRNSNAVFLKHYKSFKFPQDVTVYASDATGEPASNSAIAALLNQGTTYANCASVSNNAPSIFPPGKTPVIFTVTDNKTVKVQDTSYVTVINKHDECSTALTLQSCVKTVVDNYGATPSTSIPAFRCYHGNINDVWFKIYPSYNSLSVETYQVAGGLNNLVMQAFSGSCDNLHELGCADTNSFHGQTKITLTNLSNLDPVYIRVTTYGGNSYGQFGLLYNNYAGSSGADIFSSREFVTGDDASMLQYPTLTGDVNGDGRTDLIFAYYDSNLGAIVKTKMSNGNGNYTAYMDTIGNDPQIFYRPALAGDVNGDGKTDLIFVYYDSVHGSTIRTEISNGNGTFTAYTDIIKDGIEIFTRPALTGDINGDGKTDVIFAYYDSARGSVVKTKISNGNGTFTGYEHILADGSQLFANSTLTGDVNGDGKTDLIFVYYDPSVGAIIRTKMSDGNGSIELKDVIADGSQILANPTLRGDVNGDGKTDLIFVYYDPSVGAIVRTKMSNGNGTYTAYADTIRDGSQIFDNLTLTGDINGDGKTDLIFIGQNWQGCGLNIRVKLSNGDGTWCPNWQLLGDGPEVNQYPALTGNINNDKKMDIILTTYDSLQGVIIKSKISNSVSCSRTDSVFSSFPYSYVVAYPNPATNYVQFKTDTLSIWNIRIINSMGAVLQSYEKINSSIKLNLNSLPSGLYFIDILDIKSGKRTTKKIIKNR